MALMANCLGYFKKIDFFYLLIIIVTFIIYNTIEV